MSFGQPHAFWLLALVAALALLDQLRRSVASRPWPSILRLRAHATSIECPPRATNRDRRWRLWVGLALIVVALAGPRLGHIRRPVTPPPREVVVAIDLSKSMLARDVKPSRLDHAKLLAGGLAEKSAGDRLALVLFSSTAYMALPLSDDYVTFAEFLPGLSPEYFPKSGTNFGAMLSASASAFGRTPDTERFLVVLSDGEAFDDTWKAPLEELKQRGVHVIGIGIGTKTGDLILEDGVTLRNPAGAEVISRLNSTTLEEFAHATGGAYLPGASWVDVQGTLKTAVKGSAASTTFVVDETQLVERYRWLVVPALLLLAWSFWLEFPVKPSLRQIHLPTPAAPVSAMSARLGASVATAAAAVALLFIAVPPRLHSQDEDDQRRQMEADPRSPLRSLGGLVSQRITGILENPHPNSNDCVSLVIDIVAYCENTLRARQRFPVSIIDDGNKAIDWGEKMDPQGGAWNKLRGDLQVLLKADIEPWKVARPDGAGKMDVETGFDPNTEMKNDKHASGLRVANPSAEIDGEEVKGSFADTPAFGNMSPSSKNLPESDEPPLESDQQVVGGKKNSNDERDRHPELVLPLQKLEQVRRADMPAKLFQMLEAKRDQFVAPTPEW